MGRKQKFKLGHYRVDDDLIRANEGREKASRLRGVKKIAAHCGAAIFLSEQAPRLFGGFGGRLFELGGFGRRAHRDRRGGAAGDGDSRGVEIAGAKLALLLLLDFVVSRNAAITVALGEIEHTHGCGRLPRMTQMLAK